MYIFIFEDGTTEKSDEVRDDDLTSCDDGVLSILDISNNEDPKTYWDGEWVPIMSVNLGPILDD